ncbi:hypothetical protein COV15_00995 [Candidatus Woesearchaeota archaeon CG10_big_fil_rev_8_21_14_0_10_34_12]|nr:MAG: hypothetical protein COV15_00995 [Candidatus Woesearchaeota archaeon CG10_big_fil_rev_8_21_14_0_10_34_12]
MANPMEKEREDDDGEKEEEGLEEEVSEDDFDFPIDDFSSFVPSSSLPSLDLGIEDGVQGIEDTPAPRRSENLIEETGNEESEEQKYMQRKYRDAESNESPILRGLRESNVMVDLAELQHMGHDNAPGRIETSGWHGCHNLGDENLKEEYLVNLDNKWEDKLPFEQQDKKYKGRRVE